MISIATPEQTENLASGQTHCHYTELSAHVFIFQVSDLGKRTTKFAVFGSLFNVDMEAVVRH